MCCSWWCVSRFLNNLSNKEFLWLEIWWCKTNKILQVKRGIRGIDLYQEGDVYKWFGIFMGKSKDKDEEKCDIIDQRKNMFCKVKSHSDAETKGNERVKCKIF